MTRDPRVRIRWVLALAYFAAGAFMHLQFSLWLVRQRDGWFGRMAYADLMPAVVIAGATALVAWLAVRIRSSARPWLGVCFWVLWLGTVALIDRFLTYSINEYAHYPQYALLAWLVARAMDPDRRGRYFGRVMFWTTLLGMADELLQYTWITTSYSDYLDFNDFLTNLVAAAAGTMLYYTGSSGGARGGERTWPVVEIGASAVLALLVVTGLLTDRIVQTPLAVVQPGGFASRPEGGSRFYLQRGPAFFSSLQASKRHARYHVLAPMPGLAILLLTGLVFGVAGRRAIQETRSGPEG